MVTEGVELLAHRPLEVSPFNEDEPQLLRHASTREAFVRLVHYYLLLAEVREMPSGADSPAVVDSYVVVVPHLPQGRLMSGSCITTRSWQW